MSQTPTLETETLDERQKAQLSERSELLTGQYRKFLDQHPELRHLLSDFLSDILVNRPPDVFESYVSWSRGV
ncbi:hypothetical protein PAPYR_3314 [Paratrimastix pyriformis]|uniref:Uncharacterized protein n=1 Tax=Paratrimastix pyriformis TaxID=342808 RepID=A0ABQ8URG5_9EUKA|nr:hypothetical protein PAPYR_3314 [Paratrimastix pyriformis]